MYIKKELQKRFIISMITVVVLVLTIISSSYALFLDVESNVVDQVMSVGDLQITYNGGAAINNDNIEPMSDVNALLETDNVYTFTIQNNGTLAYHFTVYLEDNPDYLTGGQYYNSSRTLLNHSYIRYNFNNEEALSLGDAENGIIFTGSLNPGEARLYAVRLWVADASTYQLPNSALGSEIHLNITVDGKAGESGPTKLGIAVLLQEPGGVSGIVAKGNPNFNAIEGTGLYATGDVTGTSYYYRGQNDLLKNNVIFAGFQWKIIRIDGSGNIRLIYNGTENQFNETSTMNVTGTNTQISSSPINSTSTDNSRVGYMIGTDGGTYEQTHTNLTNSTIKNVVDSWYAANIANKGENITSKIADAIYCADRTLASGTGAGLVVTHYGASGRLDTNKSPSLQCTRQTDQFGVNIGNQNLTYPVAMITADEVSFAGAVRVVANTTNYLYTNHVYWTLSPYSFNGSYARGWLVSAAGALDGYGVNVTYGIRPVIALNQSVETNSGDGSLQNPFRISD